MIGFWFKKAIQRKQSAGPFGPPGFLAISFAPNNFDGVAGRGPPENQNVPPFPYTMTVRPARSFKLMDTTIVF